MMITEALSSWRVLVVDDEPDNLNLVRDFLTFSGAQVTQAEGGYQALDMIDRFHPNIILLDLAMPDIDGWETYKLLRARPDLNEVPIVALTALAMPADGERVRAAGFDAYITKPFRVRVLLNSMLDCVRNFVPKNVKDG